MKKATKISDLACRVLALTEGGRDVSVKRVQNEFRAEKPSGDALVFAFADLLDAGLLVRSAPGRYSRPGP